MYEKTNCVLMVQRYKLWADGTNLFSEPPRFFNKNLAVWKIIANFVALKR